MLPKSQKEEIKYKEFYDQYISYMRSSTQRRYTNIFIPKGTPMLVWYETWQFNDDMTDFQHMWRKWEKTFYIPDGIARWDTHISNKDVTIPMVLVSYRNEKGVPESRIITELYGEKWPVNIGEYTATDIETYGLWIKMYEQPYYIPELGTTIVAYGVYEQNLPKVGDCFKYGNLKHGVGNLTYKANQPNGWNINSNAAHGGIYQPKTIDPNAPGQWSGTITYPTIRPDPLSTKGQSIINQYTERMRLDSNGNFSYNMVCQICGMDTSYVEYDYLGSGTNHLACEVKDTMKNIFSLEN